MEATQQLLTGSFPNLQFALDKSLAPLSYFKIGGNAEVYLETADEKEVSELAKFCNDNAIKLTVLGGASNVLISDQGIKGLVLRYTLDTVTEEGKSGDGKHLIQAGAGIRTAILVSKTVALGFTGLEYFLGVPGTLGGAVYNNSHYLEDLIGEHITRVKVCNQAGEIYWLDQEECQFGYDYSRFHETTEIILEVEFALAEGESESSRELIKKATEYRAKTQPLGPPSSGCIFRNVPNNDSLRAQFPQFADKAHVPAGFLIDQAGLKGTKFGGVEVSNKHAAWMINNGHASSDDVVALIKKVKETVKEKFGVELHEEIFLLK